MNDSAIGGRRSAIVRQRPMSGASRRAASGRSGVAGAVIVAAALAACGAPGERSGRVDVVRDTAEVNGTRLYYEVAGAGSPVILLQGGNLPLEMWDDQFAELARAHRVVRYDARGFGRSAPKSGPYASHDDLLALLQHLGIEKASLVGLSLGGRVAVDFALEHPEMVDRLVLAGPGLSGFAWSNEREPWVDTLVAAYDRRDSVGMALSWLQSGYMKPAMRDSALAARLRELTSLNASMWMQPDSETVLEPPAVGRLASLRAPTLVIVGSLDISDIQRIVDTLATTVPGARKVVIEDAGHMVNMERPLEFTAAVREFLKG
jgi:pimeloyl-ACP methyl ester carboxylesterase